MRTLPPSGGRGQSSTKRRHLAPPGVDMPSPIDAAGQTQRRRTRRRQGLQGSYNASRGHQGVRDPAGVHRQECAGKIAALP